MATRRSHDDEKLDPANLDKVIGLLEPKDPAVKAITKKEACAILGIAYNTTRLGTLIEKHKEKKARDAERRAALRGKPATDSEISYIIQEYLEGATVTSLAERSYRSAQFVNNILEKYGVPIRAKAHDYFRPEMVPESAMRESFAMNEIVYSMRYDSLARIDAELVQDDRFVYRVWLVSDKWQQFAYQPVEELASLEHLRTLGVKI